jgi:hypothetical protein
LRGWRPISAALSTPVPLLFVRGRKTSLINHWASRPIYNRRSIRESMGVVKSIPSKNKSIRLVSPLPVNILTAVNGNGRPPRPYPRPQRRRRSAEPLGFPDLSLGKVYTINDLTLLIEISDRKSLGRAPHPSLLRRVGGFVEARRSHRSQVGSKITCAQLHRCKTPPTNFEFPIYSPADPLTLYPHPLRI